MELEQIARTERILDDKETKKIDYENIGRYDAIREFRPRYGSLNRQCSTNGPGR